MYHANVNVNWQCECKKLHVKDYIWNPATCSWEYDKHFASIIDNSVITCNEIIDAKSKSWDEETKTVPTNFNEKKMQSEKQKKSIYYLLFFINYHNIIDKCQYLLLHDNISSKTKTFIVILSRK